MQIVKANTSTQKKKKRSSQLCYIWTCVAGCMFDLENVMENSLMLSTPADWISTQGLFVFLDLILSLIVQ